MPTILTFSGPMKDLKCSNLHHALVLLLLGIRFYSKGKEQTHPGMLYLYLPMYTKFKIIVPQITKTQITKKFFFSIFKLGQNPFLNTTMVSYHLLNSFFSSCSSIVFHFGVLEAITVFSALLSVSLVTSWNVCKMMAQILEC